MFVFVIWSISKQQWQVTRDILRKEERVAEETRCRESMLTAGYLR